MPRFFLLFVLLGSLAGAQNLDPRPFSFKWKAVEAAGGYQVEVADPAGTVVQSLQVGADQLAATASLVPGNYRIRITTLNRFLKPEGSTDWMPAHVAALRAPEVDEFAPVRWEPGTEGALELRVKGWAQDGLVYLVGPDGRRVPAQAGFTESGTLSVKVPALRLLGDYDLVVLNPPVLATLWHSHIGVHYPVPETAVTEVPVRTDTAPEALDWTVSGLSAEAKVELQDPEGALEAVEFERRDMGIRVPWGTSRGVGTYRYAVRNGPGEVSVVLGTVVVTPPPPPPATLDVWQISSEVSAASGADLGGAWMSVDADHRRLVNILQSGEAEVVAGAPGLGQPVALVRTSGNSSVVLDLGNASLRTVTLAGEVTKFADLSLYRVGAGVIYGLAFDDDRVLSVSDPAGGTIHRFDGQGKALPDVGQVGRGWKDGPWASARFASPQGLAVDEGGLVYVADSGNNRIRRITPDGQVSTWVGTGQAGGRDGPREEATLDEPVALAADPWAGLVVFEKRAHRLRRIAADGRVITVSQDQDRELLTGVTGLSVDQWGRLVLFRGAQPPLTTQLDRLEDSAGGFVWAGAGVPFFREGRASMAGFSAPRGLTVDALGRIFIADTENHRIRELSPSREVSTYLGDGVAGAESGGGFGKARLNRPTLLAGTPGRDWYVVDQGNGLLRQIRPDKSLVTVCPVGRVVDLQLDSFGTLNWIEDDGTGRLRLMTRPRGGVSSEVSGPWAQPGSLALGNLGLLAVADATQRKVFLGFPSGEWTAVAFPQEASDQVALAKGDRSLLLFDLASQRLYSRSTGSEWVSFPSPVQWSGQGQWTVNAGWIYAVDAARNQLLATSWPAAFESDGRSSVIGYSLAEPVAWQNPQAVAVHPEGGLVVADGRRVVRWNADGSWSVLAGSDQTGDRDGRPDQARFGLLSGVVVAPDGTAYLSDQANHSIRVVSPQGTVSTLVRGLGKPHGLVLTGHGALLVADAEKRQILEVTLQGQTRVWAGSGAAEPKDGAANQAGFLAPHGLAWGPNQTLVVADDAGLRVVTASKQVSTLAGSTLANRWARVAPVEKLPSQLWSVAVLADGTILADDRLAGRLYRYSPLGDGLNWISALNPGDADGPFPAVVRPLGMAADAQGVVWFADQGTLSVRAVATEGTPVPANLIVREPQTEPLGPAARTISPQAGFEAWAGVLPVATGDLQTPDVRGTRINALYLALDDQYVYWMMPLLEGKPDRGDGAVFYLNLKTAASWDVHGLEFGVDIDANDWANRLAPGRSPENLSWVPQESNDLTAERVQGRMPRRFLKDWLAEGHQPRWVCFRVAQQATPKHKAFYSNELRNEIDLRALQ